MRWHDHSNCNGHSFLSGSNYSWTNYSEDDLYERYVNRWNSIRGTQLHDLAASLIKMRQPLPDIHKTLNMYVNDGIFYRMSPEIRLYYSDNSSGIADAISFRDNILRIHDLKTGYAPTSFKQLEIYASYFFLEYNIIPNNIYTELRIYQNDDIYISRPTIDTFYPIMDRIVYFDRKLEEV